MKVLVFGKGMRRLRSYLIRAGHPEIDIQEVSTLPNLSTISPPANARVVLESFLERVDLLLLSYDIQTAEHIICAYATARGVPIAQALEEDAEESLRTPWAQHFFRMGQDDPSSMARGLLGIHRTIDLQRKETERALSALLQHSGAPVPLDWFETQRSQPTKTQHRSQNRQISRTSNSDLLPPEEWEALACVDKGEATETEVAEAIRYSNIASISLRREALKLQQGPKISLRDALTLLLDREILKLWDGMPLEKRADFVREFLQDQNSIVYNRLLEAHTCGETIFLLQKKEERSFSVTLACTPGGMSSQHLLCTGLFEGSPPAKGDSLFINWTSHIVGDREFSPHPVMKHVNITEAITRVRNLYLGNNKS